MTTVTEIVLHHFQKWRQLQRSYLTTSKSDDSYRDRTWPLPKATTVTEIVLDHFQKWRQLQRSYFSVLQKWRQSQRSSPNRSFRARLPSKTNLQSQFLTTVTRGKPGASPRQARGRLNPPFRGAYFRRRSSALFLAKHSISRAGYLPKSYFKLQKWQQLQRSYFTTSKSDDSYRDRTWPLPKVTTVTEIVLDHFQKWRQLQRSYLTTSKSDDSYRDRTSAYSKSDDSHRDHRQIEAFVRDFLQKRISKVNFWRQSHGASPGQARGKPAAGWTRRFAELTFDVGAAHFSLQNTAFREPAIYPNHTSSCKNDNSHRDRTSPLPKVTTVTEIVLDHFQKWRQLQKSYLTTSKSDDRDRTWPLPKVTTKIVLDHFQKWRQLQRSYFSVLQKWRQSQRSSPNRSFRARLPSKTNLQSQFLTTVTRGKPGARGKPAASPRQAEPAVSRSLLSTSEQRTFPCKTQHFASRLSTQIILQVAKMTTVTEIVLHHFQKWRQLQRSYLTTSKSDDRRQLKRSYLTTSKSDDSYRDRTWPLPKVTTVTEIVLQRTPKVTTVTEIIAKSKLSCETSFKNESPKSIFDDSHTKPEASQRQARGRLNPPFRGAYFRRWSSALFLAKHSISRAGYLPKLLQVAKMTTVTGIVLDHFQKRRQLQRSYLTTSKSDDSYRDRTWPLPKVTTVTEIVPHDFQKWRQLQKSYLTTSKSDDSYRDRTTVHHFQKWRQLQRSFPKRSFRALALAILCFSYPLLELSFALATLCFSYPLL